ncbi:MAG: PEP/pyruvate-binding domain-containing protein [Desulfobacca sp.]|uniref:PEP/pyruvate-binding domain-containing protein n=1 Tax=Desulfobacca sp. TaxID=2067990 RepID=UPI00404B866B
MKYLIPLAAIAADHRLAVGGKAFALAQLAKLGFRVPRAGVLPIAAYHAYVDATGLRERILLELHRKDFQDMRWEEIWDAALRIRNMFLTTPLPADLAAALTADVQEFCGDAAVAVRSSAPGEDSAQASFAGLHESYVNIQGAAAIVQHILLVWASLWSDAALLYRQELGLDVAASAMAVVIQELVAGDCSGVAFSRNPSDETQTVIEAVYGLNQGLVDGVVEPDRWLLDRQHRHLTHVPPAARPAAYQAEGQMVVLRDLDPRQAAQPPLTEAQVWEICALAQQAEAAFGSPQDVEWTMRQGEIYVLQSRPITTVANETKDQRPWYLSLRRSFANLQALRQRIEGELLPAMTAAAEAFQQEDLAGLTDADLAAALQRRLAAYDHWHAVYWRDFIPFAHGMRLFGQLYNDAMRPQDPYEFMTLLAGAPLASLARNRHLAALAAQVRQDAGLAELIRQRQFNALPPAFQRELDEFLQQFGDLSCPVTGGQCQQGPEAILRLVLEMANHPPRPVSPPAAAATLTQAFFEKFSGSKRQEAAAILELAQASYRLRDDDNLYLGRLEAQKTAAIQEVHRRLQERGLTLPAGLPGEEILQAFLDPAYKPTMPENTGQASAAVVQQARQLIGQPAGPGLARGPARVIQTFADLADFRHGEILVCDAVDPNMTFVVPLAAAVVERRGGMLIHGAIIAREYGLPCVTGVPDATRLIHTGDVITVDGYLGLIIIE